MDARDPLFYASHDLATYVSEVAPVKASVYLLNKADYLTPEQRTLWADYFKRSDMKTLFFSATDINDRYVCCTVFYDSGMIFQQTPSNSKAGQGQQRIW